MIATRTNWIDSEGTILKTRVRNWRNWRSDLDSAPETFNDDGTFSVVPNMVLSMKQVLDRHQRGVMLPSNSAFFDDELPNMSGMDKMDVIDMMRENAQIIDDHQKGLSKAAASKAAAAQAAQAAELQKLRDFAANHKTDSNAS